MVVPNRTWQDVLQSGLPKARRDQAEDLADLLDRVMTPPTALGSAQVETLCQSLIEIREVVGVLPDNVGEQRDYLLERIGYCLGLLDRETPDFREVRAVANEVVGGCVPIESYVGENVKEGFIRSCLRAVGVFARDVSAGVVGGVGASVVNGLLGF